MKMPTRIQKSMNKRYESKSVNNNIYKGLGLSIAGEDSERKH